MFQKNTFSFTFDLFDPVIELKFGMISFEIFQ